MIARYGDKIKMNKSRKNNQNTKFSPLKSYSLKPDVWNEYTKTKGLHHASKYLICKKTVWLKIP